MHVIFTDLDGTLLDHETYSFEAAQPALERLARKSVPVVFTTSKTRAEIEPLREQTGNSHPFISENGGAIFIPILYFPSTPEGAVRHQEYDVIEYGDRYESLVAALDEASRRSGCRIRGFSSMTPEEIAALCGLSAEDAALASQREYDEPFEILDPHRAESLLEQITLLGKRWTRGGRFYHILGNSDKAAAVARLTGMYRQAYGDTLTVGLGDGLNDVEFLKLVDVPIIVRSRDAEKIQAAVFRGRVTAAWGPRGWNEAISEVFPD